MKRIILLVLVVLFISPVYAQDVTSTFCGDLPQADCTILQDSAAAMLTLESTAFHLEADFNVSDIPDAPFEALTLHLTGDGSFAADSDSFLALKPTDMMSEGMFPMLADMLRGVAADMSFTLDVPEELTALMAQGEQTIPNSLPLDFRMVDGIAYFNLQGVAGLARDGAIPAGWVGLDVAELYGTILPGMSQEAMAGFDMMPMMTALMQPENTAKFLTITRLPDAEVMGQTMAVFETSIDYVAMLEVPAFRDMLQSVMAAQGAEANVDESMSVIRAMYEGMTLVMTQHIGLDDKLVHQSDMHMEWDLARFGASIGEETMPGFAFDLSITQEALDSAPQVIAPEEAFLIPLEQMIPSADASS